MCTAEDTMKRIIIITAAVLIGTVAAQAGQTDAYPISFGRMGRCAAMRSTKPISIFVISKPARAVSVRMARR